jgi:pimeloyl-ACP methyl ester carboxylesterase
MGRARSFGRVLRRRRWSDAAHGALLARFLRTMSSGRAPSLWQELRAAGGQLPPLLVVAGEHDAKFRALAERTVEAATQGGCGQAALAVVPGCGHAVHEERPLELMATLEAHLSRTDRQRGSGAGRLWPPPPNGSPPDGKPD